MNQPNTVRRKSIGMALLLVTWFGPFGLLYSSKKGGAIMIVSLFAPFALIFGVLFWLSEGLEKIVYAGSQWSSAREVGASYFNFNDLDSLGTYFAASYLIILAIFVLHIISVWVVSMIWALVATIRYNNNSRSQPAGYAANEKQKKSFPFFQFMRRQWEYLKQLLRRFATTTWLRKRIKKLGESR